MGPEVVIGAVACILCTLCSCFCLASQEERRRRSQGRAPALCGVPGASSGQYPSDELLYTLQLQETANAQADRAARLDAYIERQAKFAAENWLKGQNAPPAQAQPVRTTPGAAPVVVPGISGQAPAGRIEFLSSRVPIFVGQPGCQCSNFEPYNPNARHHGKIIYNL